jgi:hypothetical protein
MARRRGKRPRLFEQLDSLWVIFALDSERPEQREGGVTR